MANKDQPEKMTFIGEYAQFIPSFGEFTPGQEVEYNPELIKAFPKLFKTGKAKKESDFRGRQ